MAFSQMAEENHTIPARIAKLQCDTLDLSLPEYAADVLNTQVECW
jgi:hypothetical protein